MSANIQTGPDRARDNRAYVRELLAGLPIDVAETIVGKQNMNREGPFVMASEDFSYMLEKVPGAFINIGNGGGEGGCEVHNPGYDFNDDILPLGSALHASLVEQGLPLAA